MRAYFQKVGSGIRTYLWKVLRAVAYQIWFFRFGEEIQKNLLFLQAYMDNGDITEEDIVEAIPKDFAGL